MKNNKKFLLGLEVILKVLIENDVSRGDLRFNDGPKLDLMIICHFKNAIRSVPVAEKIHQIYGQANSRNSCIDFFESFCSNYNVFNKNTLPTEMMIVETRINIKDCLLYLERCTLKNQTKGKKKPAFKLMKL